MRCQQSFRCGHISWERHLFMQKCWSLLLGGWCGIHIFSTSESSLGVSAITTRHPRLRRALVSGKVPTVCLLTLSSFIFIHRHRLLLSAASDVVMIACRKFWSLKSFSTLEPTSTGRTPMLQPQCCASLAQHSEAVSTHKLLPLNPPRIRWAQWQRPFVEQET